jgi:hypothetical protein
MNVGAVGAVHASGGSVVVFAETAAVAVRAPDAPVVTPSTTPAAPFANPAISRIAENAAFASLQAPTAVLSGDSGFLVQSYGAVALVEAPLALSPVYAQLALPAIPKVDPIIRPAGARPPRG